MHSQFTRWCDWMTAFVWRCVFRAFLANHRAGFSVRVGRCLPSAVLVVICAVSFVFWYLTVVVN